ncbi:cob(II)yrinic acid a,c-diamide reductase [Aureimonas ureilytica]|uniref:Cob(II)yrinic acid a,c-diamide reductase n=1 Tax=Aureimonas ureilytica TaxID=401562 RepID=A0A175RMW0_9HYPH|nr:MULTISPECIES: 5,6-dimethylbenzimidazole synthase [Aureimonas]KTR05060.1 cob(II)yrinic acid a,c-diamide reductase [Aureimonas ureilytica]
MNFDAGFRAELLRLFQWRRDVRHFRPDALPDGTLERLLEIATLAPSVGLSEPWRFVVVADPTRRAAIRADFQRCNTQAACAQTAERAALYARLKLEGMEAAPVQFAVFAEGDPEQGHGLGRRSMPETATYSAALAVHTLWLAARAEGLGLGWVSILDPATLRDVLDVPESWRFIGYFCLGFPMLESDTPELQRAGWETRRRLPEKLLYR